MRSARFWTLFVRIGKLIYPDKTLLVLLLLLLAMRALTGERHGAGGDDPPVASGHWWNGACHHLHCVGHVGGGQSGRTGCITTPQLTVPEWCIELR